MDVRKIIESDQSNQQPGMYSTENIKNDIPNNQATSNVRNEMPIMMTGAGDLENQIDKPSKSNEDDIELEAEKKIRQPFLIEMGETIN